MSETRAVYQVKNRNRKTNNNICHELAVPNFRASFGKKSRLGQCTRGFAGFLG